MDSAEVRERRTAHGLTDLPSADQNSATESTEEYEIPTEVNQRISEWFSRNEQAQSRQSEANDNNLEDIRQKAKDRIKEKNNQPMTVPVQPSVPTVSTVGLWNYLWNFFIGKLLKYSQTVVTSIF